MSMTAGQVAYEASLALDMPSMWERMTAREHEYWAWIARAVAEECAKLCDQVAAEMHPSHMGSDYLRGCANEAASRAAAIRGWAL